MVRSGDGQECEPAQARLHGVAKVQGLRKLRRVKTSWRMSSTDILLGYSSPCTARLLFICRRQGQRAGCTRDDAPGMPGWNFRHGIAAVMRVSRAFGLFLPGEQRRLVSWFTHTRASTAATRRAFPFPIHTPLKIAILLKCISQKIEGECNYRGQL